MKLLLICSITLNLNLIATDRAVAGAGVGAGVPEVALSGEAQEEYLNKIFQAVLDIHTLAKQAKENLAPHGLKPEVTVTPECYYGSNGTKGGFYMLLNIENYAMVTCPLRLYTPWGSVPIFKGHTCSFFEISKISELMEREFYRYLKSELIDNRYYPSYGDIFQFQPYPRHTGIYHAAYELHEVKAVNGMALSALTVSDREPVEWRADWDKRMSRHSAQSARWSDNRKAWCVAVLRSGLALEESKKAAACVGVERPNLKKSRL